MRRIAWVIVCEVETRGRALGLALNGFSMCHQWRRAERHPQCRTSPVLAVVPASPPPAPTVIIRPVLGAIPAAIIPWLGFTGGDLCQGQRTNACGEKPGRSPHCKSPPGQLPRRIDDLIVFFAHPLDSPLHGDDRARRPPTNHDSGSRRSSDLPSVWGAGSEGRTAEGREFRWSFSPGRRTTNVGSTPEGARTGSDDILVVVTQVRSVSAHSVKGAEDAAIVHSP